MKENEEVQFLKTDATGILAGHIESIWTVRNLSAVEKYFTILPDGYFDLVLRFRADGSSFLTLSGIWTNPFECVLPPHAVFQAFSFKLSAVDALFHSPVAKMLNGCMRLPADFWGLNWSAVSGFETFAKQVSLTLFSRLNPHPDNRRDELFSSIYAAQGNIKIAALARQVHWSSRQINRYFNHRFGLSLKAYCNILRYRASFEQLEKGKVYPEQDYTDQAHFIREVKKYSGSTPGQLAKNKNDRFIQLSTLSRK